MDESRNNPNVPVDIAKSFMGAVMADLIFIYSHQVAHSIETFGIFIVSWTAGHLALKIF